MQLKKKIFIDGDENDSSLFFLRDLLEDNNFNVAIGKFPDADFQNTNLVILFDYTEYSSLVTEEKFKNLSFLFLISNEETLKAEELNKAAEDYIITPVDDEVLLSRINALLKRSDIFKSYLNKINLEKSISKESNQILLIDDDPKLIKLFEYNLKKAGYETRTAFSGKNALEILNTYFPDLILCDIMMPEMDGFQLRRILLENPDLKTIPFVFLSAKSEESEILEGYDLEIEDYILKTAGPRIVIAKVSAILKGRDKERKKLVSEIHQAADTLRAKVVPDTFPEFDGFEIRHWYQPYKGIPGGDFIDYFMLDEDNLVIILGDVMGKKWGAWYFAIAYAGYIRSAVRVVLQSADELSSSKLLQKVNESIYHDAKVSEVFTTISVMILNRKTKTAKYAGAGDLPVLYKDSITGEINEMQSQGLLLGFSYDGEYQDIKMDLKKNDLLFLMSDGIIESRNNDGEMLGINGFKNFIRKIELEDNPVDNTMEQLQLYTNGNFEDDISVIAIRTR